MSYLGRTFCTGGAPRCAKFVGCPRALTPEHQARATALNLPASLFAAPEAMPCYSTDPAAVWGTVTKKKFFRIPDLTEAEWRAKFALRLSDMAVAKQIGCSVTTARTARVRLGLPRRFNPGQTADPLYGLGDVAKIKAARKPGEPLLVAARRAGYRTAAARHICSKFREDFL
jgi:hypothetical protein